MNVFLLLLMIWRPLEKPALIMEDQRFITLHVPPGVLADDDFKRRLFSGLTTSIELETELRGVSKESAVSLIEIRYDVWEELLLVRKFEPGGTVSRVSLANLDELRQWFDRVPLRIYALSAEHLNRVLTVKVTCRVIPFSKAEQHQTQAWFANLAEVPDAAQRGQISRTRNRESTSTENGGNGIFRVLMTTSIERQSVVTYKWRWTETFGRERP